MDKHKINITIHWARLSTVKLIFYIYLLEGGYFCHQYSFIQYTALDSYTTLFNAKCTECQYFTKPATVFYKSLHYEPQINKTLDNRSLDNCCNTKTNIIKLYC